MPLKEALKLAPDTWEARYVESQLLWEKVSLEPPGADAAQRLGDSKASSEIRKTASRLADDSLRAINKAVALHEKTAPDPKDRSPKLYIARMFSRFQVEAMRKIIAAQENGQPPPFPTKFEYDFSFDKAAIRDIEQAASCEPDNPYAILTLHLMRAYESKTYEESERALARLAVIEKQPSIDPEDRLRVLEVQTIFLSMQKKSDAAAEKTLQGLALSPSRELFCAVHPINLIKQKKFAEAERFVRDRLKKYDTPFNRMVLARAQLAQNDFAGAERTLIRLIESDKSTATPSLFLATVRLKATSSNTSKTRLREIRDFVEGLERTQTWQLSSEEKLSKSLLIATYYALDGGEDIAKTMIKSVLEKDEDNEAAKSLLAVLP